MESWWVKRKIISSYTNTQDSMDWYNYSLQFIWSSGTNPVFDKRAFARLRGLEISMCREYSIKKEPSEK